MDEKFRKKYERVKNIINDIAECTDKKLILAGGTALALFYLKHRISVDLDFVPVKGDEEKLKQELKGCLTKKGYRTIPAVYKNQFVIQFEDTSIKVEIFLPEYKIKKMNEFRVGNSKLLVASLEDILELKIESYKNRKEARDIFDILFILKKQNKKFGLVKKLIRENGKPENEEEMKKVIENEENYQFLKRVIKDVL